MVRCRTCGPVVGAAGVWQGTSCSEDLTQVFVSLPFMSPVSSVTVFLKLEHASGPLEG